MSRMGEVGVSIIGVLKCDDEAVSVTLMQVFWADVGTHFEASDFLDLFRQTSEGVTNHLYRRRIQIVIELE
jgi:hypothetical protein